jgi:hypothetical protein
VEGLVRKISFISLAAIVLVSCAKQSSRGVEEANILISPSFSEESSAIAQEPQEAQLAALGFGDSGSIPRPPQSGGGDSGSIPQPGTSSGGTSGGSTSTTPPTSDSGGSTSTTTTNPPSSDGTNTASNPPPSSGDSGNIPQTPPSDGSTGDGGTIPNPDEEVAEDSGKVEMPIEFRRVCSVYRSTLQDFIFFEEAEHPYLSVTAQYMDPNDPYAYLKSLYMYYGVSLFGNLWSVLFPNSLPAQTYTLYHRPLNDVNLLNSRHLELALLDMKILEQNNLNSLEGVSLNAVVCDDKNQNGECEETGYNILNIFNMPFTANAIPQDYITYIWSGRTRTLWSDPLLCDMQMSPLVLDLKRDGVNLVGPETGVDYDLNDQGKAVRTGWPLTTDDAFLVRDLNSNGRIDSGRELFGSATRLSNGERASNGFEALKELDADKDNRFTLEDPAWSSVQLWIDGNHDGVSQAKELYSLEKFGLESIDLNYIEMMERDRFGNETRQRSVFRLSRNGEKLSSRVIDVWFNTLQKE